MSRGRALWKGDRCRGSSPQFQIRAAVSVAYNGVEPGIVKHRNGRLDKSLVTAPTAPVSKPVESRPIARSRLMPGVPADRLASVIGQWRDPALLESGPGFGDAGRWSVLAANPRLTFEATGSSWVVRGGRGGAATGQGDVLARLGRLLDQFDLARPDDISSSDIGDGCPFQGGMIGFIGYDAAPLLERLPRRAPRDSRFPDVRLALYDTAVIVDHQTGKATLRAWDMLKEGARAVERRCARWLKALQDGSDRPRPIPRSRLGPVEADLDRADYLARVGRVLEYIRAGDVFQANFTQRFTAVGNPDPLDLYLRLKSVSPAPFSAFLRLDSLGDNLAVVSASPEWFYQTRGDRILTRPIKGTRPRGVDPAQDRRLADELARSAKDRAELTMIVDLERNDLGRVCQYGTVRVLDPLAVESYAQVHHLVATVEGKLRDGVGPVDVVRALFPGGSITGAPKIRAMEVIDELEPNRRGVYTGAIGYLSRGGSSGFNIAIRTLLVEGDRVSYQVGGGIVADSDPEAEYEETLHKGRGLRAVLEGEGGRP